MNRTSFHRMAGLYAIALFLLVACSSPLERAVLAEAGEDPPAVEVVLSSQGDHLLAEWKLPAPVTEFLFDDDAMSVPERQSEWAILSDAFEFDGVKVSRADGAAFDTFSFTVPPARGFYDRFYVPVFRVGQDGWGVYVWAFAPEAEGILIHADGFPEGAITFADGVVLQANEGIAALDSDLIYFGPPENVHEGVVDIVAGDDVPDWLRAKLDAEINDGVARLTDRLGRAPDEEPVLFVTYENDWNGNGWKGGSVGCFITAHLRGMRLEPDDSGFLGDLTNIALHEASHVWLGQMYASSENDSQSWLHEGAAEYVANRLWMTPAKLQEAARDAVNQCRSLIGSASLRETQTASRGPAPYKCGFLVQLIADAAARQQGTGDILGIWRAVFAEATPNEDGVPAFDSALFRSVAARFGGEAFTDRLDQLEAGLSPDGWRTFIQDLSDLDIETQPYGLEDISPDDRNLSAEVLKALLLDTCQGGYSIYGERDHYFLDMGESCPPPLDNGPKLAGVNGLSLVNMSGAAYSSVRKACAEGEPLIFTGLDGADLPPLACGSHLRDLPDVVTLNSLPDFAPL